MKLFHTVKVRTHIGDGAHVKRTFHFATAEARDEFIRTAYHDGLIEPKPQIDFNCDHLMTAKEAMAECRATLRYYAKGEPVVIAG